MNCKYVFKKVHTEMEYYNVDVILKGHEWIRFNEITKIKGVNQIQHVYVPKELKRSLKNNTDPLWDSRGFLMLKINYFYLKVYLYI